MDLRASYVPAYDPPAGLVESLNASYIPIYIGFVSIVTEDPGKMLFALLHTGYRTANTNATDQYQAQKTHPPRFLDRRSKPHPRKGLKNGFRERVGERE